MNLIFSLKLIGFITLSALSRVEIITAKKAAAFSNKGKKQFESHKKGAPVANIVGTQLRNIQEIQTHTVLKEDSHSSSSTSRSRT